MTIDTDKLKALALAATQGNWTVDKRSADCAYLNGPPRSYDECYFENAADAEFIAACREMVPELIAEVERLRAEITVLGKAPEINVENAETRMDTGFGGAGQIAAPAAGTEKDAARYRWLRDKARLEYDERIFVTNDGHKDYYAPNAICESELDGAIDEAIAAKEPPCGS